MYFNYKHMQLNNVVFFDKQIKTGCKQISLKLTGDAAVALAYFNRSLFRKDVDPIVMELSSKIKSDQPIELKIKSVTYNTFVLKEANIEEQQTFYDLSITEQEQDGTAYLRRKTSKYNDLPPKLLPDDHKFWKDPDDDRVCRDVIAPPRFALAHNKLFNNNGVIDLKILGEHLHREGRLSLDDACYLVRTATELYSKEPNVLRLRD
eukprot:99738_1